MTEIAAVPASKPNDRVEIVRIKRAIVVHYNPRLKIQVGDPVCIKYLDHTLFRHADPASYRPVELEIRGWLDFEDDQQYRIVWERISGPPPKGMDLKASGVSILKRNVLEIRSD